MTIADPSTSDNVRPIGARPELLAPAGDIDCARAAVENGADAVYFGLRSGLNARARAVNFGVEELPELMAYLHLRGVKGYLTLNTLVFPAELGEFEQAVRAAIAAGVDAVLVQDLGAVRLIRAVSPDWPVHASTQMSLTSAEGIRVAESLGIGRVVLSRELSLAEIRQIHAETRVELEVFVHGALCMSYSGQCLASFAMGGRSGNRGQCAQACRLPYELICDGRRLGLEGRPYLLSPLDLAAYDLLPELIDSGVIAVKIEGRLKSAEYVAHATALYRRAIDEAMAGRRVRLSPEELDELEMSFSRGFSHGWLEGHNDRELVPGHSSARRGVTLGTVRQVHGDRVTVELAGPIKRGDGIVFETDPGHGDPQGGRVYEVFDRKRSVTEPVAQGLVELSFGRGSLDFSRIRPGQKVRKTDDPQLVRRLRKTYAAGRSQRRVPLDLSVEAAVGRPLCITARADSGAACRIEASQVLEEAVQHPLTLEVLRQQLGRLGGSVYELRHLEARIDGRPMTPLSVLGQLRHELVRQLDAAAVKPPARKVASESVLPLRLNRTRPSPGATAGLSSSAEPPPDAALLDKPAVAPRREGQGGSEGQPSDVFWHVLCRHLAQLKSALSQGASSVIADLAELSSLGDAVAAARRQGAEILLATPRIQKPGEAEIFQRMADARPDGMLVRNLAGAAFCAERQIPFVADAPLHAANEWTVAYLNELGARRITAACDLDRPRLLDLVAAVPPEWLEVVVYQHLPMFHTEHCMFCGTMGTKADRSACGRICRQHDVRLRDRLGVEHPLRVDACCRNTFFHAEPRSLMEWVPELRHRGVRHFRIELLDGMPGEELTRWIGRGG